MPSGHGLFVFRSGHILKGNWTLGQLNGEVEIDFQEGDKYKGQYLNGLKNGEGFLRFPNGSFIEGIWKDDKLIGGKAVYYTEHTYNGTFQGDRKHGQGAMRSIEGFYKGSWVNDEKNGKGSMKYSNDDIYNGDWKKGLKDGLG